MCVCVCNWKEEVGMFYILWAIDTIVSLLMITNRLISLFNYFIYTIEESMKWEEANYKYFQYDV